MWRHTAQSRLTTRLFQRVAALNASARGNDVIVGWSLCNMCHGLYVIARESPVALAPGFQTQFLLHAELSRATGHRG